MGTFTDHQHKQRLVFTTVKRQMYCRKRLIGQSDNNSLATLLGKRVHAKLREVVNTHAEKCIQHKA